MSDSNRSLWEIEGANVIDDMPSGTEIEILGQSSYSAPIWGTSREV